MIFLLYILYRNSVFNIPVSKMEGKTSLIRTDSVDEFQTNARLQILSYNHSPGARHFK